MPAAEAPVAPPPAAAPSVMPGAAPDGRPQINVSTMPKADPTRPGIKPSPARERMREALQKVADKPGYGKTEPQPDPPKPTDPPKPNPAENASEDEGTTATPPEVKPGDDPKKTKANPWKLVDEYKAKVAAAEAKILEIEKRAIPENDWKKTQETLTQREARLKELEEEIKYVNYSKSEEFKQKFQVPYEKAWQRAMGELGELTVAMPDGQERSFAINDLLELVNLPLGKAHELATEKFGDLASEVMGQRKEIRKLFDDQHAALEEAKKTGVERDKQQTEAREKEYGEVSNNIKETWSKANEEITADPKYGTYFTPVEGDQEGNQRLAKGFELANRAFSENPLAPGLNSEQRQAIVRRHAAVRNRAAAFGRLVYQNSQSQARIKSLEKELSEYKGSQPNRGGSQPAVSPAKTGSKMEQMMQKLREMGKPI